MKKLSLVLMVFLLSLNNFAAEEVSSAEQTVPPSPQSLTDIAAKLQTYLAENGVTLLLNILAVALLAALVWLALRTPRDGRSGEEG